ncbi:hypothetical protein D1007_07018 [Hordeum vulgare]|nr:hypothetical protein D1007_07018 [Hordeum vulgare]
MMAERYPGDGAAAGGFGRRHLRGDEARLLYEPDYPTLPDMRVSGSWRLSVGGVPVPPPPTGADRTSPTATRCHANQLAATNGVEPRGWHNSRGSANVGVSPAAPWRPSSTSRAATRPRTTILHRRGNSWMPRKMETATSSSCGSRSCSSGSLALLPVKPEPLGRRTRNVDILINEPDAYSRLVKPKTEPGLLSVKQEHPAMAADDEAALKWARDDYVREEMKCQRRALEEIATHRRGREEGGGVILDESDE